MKVALFSIPRTPIAVADPILFLEGDVSETDFFSALSGKDDDELFFEIETKAGSFTVRAAAVDIFRVIS